MRKANTGRGHPYQVPYRSILPKPEECRNLLVPVALSSTHVAMSSLRIEGTWMIIGQSAGIAAALAAGRGVAVQDLGYATLRQRLLAQDQVLELPKQGRAADAEDLPGIVLDDAEARLQGGWGRSQNFKPYIGSGYIHDDRSGDGDAVATFHFTAPESGTYQLRMAYSAHDTRASNVPVVVTSGKHASKLSVDQRVAIPDNKRFRPIGRVEIVGDVESQIRVVNRDTDGYVIVDAFQLIPAE